MATATGAPTPRARALSAGAICGLALVTAIGFGRVFAEHSGTTSLIAAAGLSALLACALERRTLRWASAIGAAAMLILLGLLIAPDTLSFGMVPGPGTLAAVVGAIGHVGVQTSVQVAPTEVTGPLLLACVVALWTAIWASHALAIRAGSPVLALLPPLALIGFADVVLQGPPAPIYGVAFLGAAILLVLASNRRTQGDGSEPSRSRAGTAGARSGQRRPSDRPGNAHRRGLRPTAPRLRFSGRRGPTGR
jgi:hypothetical protein